jgi:hypothetical protein
MHVYGVEPFRKLGLRQNGIQTDIPEVFFFGL